MTKPFSSKVFTKAEGQPDEMITVTLSLPLKSLLAVEAISAISDPVLGRTDIIRTMIDQAVDNHSHKAHIEQTVESELEFIQERHLRRQNLQL